MQQVLICLPFESGWKQIFEALWPAHQKRIEVVVTNLGLHSLLIREEVTLVDMKEAQEARIRSLEHFAETHTFQENQKYLGLRARISPDLHDNRLDWLRNRSVEGCAKWLFRDVLFSEWLDVSTKTVVWFWLQGIPGAGKTYLCAAVIDYLRKQQHRTLFAFVSHTNKASLTALSVIQSFLFQAADEDEEFRRPLVESKEREIKGNTGHVAEMLKTFLATAGPTYIIVDGLDEMDECERQIIFQRLDELSKGCDDVRFLICSRAEADISKILEQKAKNIRVNDTNFGSIQNYVDFRSQNWMASCQYDSKTESEIRNLLSPLAANAKGKNESFVVSNLDHMLTLHDFNTRYVFVCAYHSG